MKIIYKSAIVGFISVIVYSCIFFVCCFCLPDAYGESYSKGFIRQYRALQKAAAHEKIIIFGGSYVPFAIDIDLLSLLSGKEVYTLGVNASMGIPYIVDMLTPYISKNDIVVMPLASFKADYYGMENIFISIDGNHDLLQSFIKKYPQRIIEDGHIWVVTKLYGSLISGIVEKLRSRYKKTEGSIDAYTISNFDERGNYILKRYENICTKSELVMKGFFNGYGLGNAELKLINGIDSTCHEKGAKLAITYSPMYKVFFTNTHAQFLEEERKLEKNVNANFISSIEACLYPKESIYDGLPHLNSYGQEDYTRKLYGDLVSHGFLQERIEK